MSKTPSATNASAIPHAHHGPLEAEDNEAPEGYGNSPFESSQDYEWTGEQGGSRTQSLTSTVFDYVYENGRRYHRYAEGKYALPNDETEQDRLDLYHHHQLLMTGGNLHLAPINPEPLNVLDCGTGTGIWALDMAETYPTAQVIGVDLSPIQPQWTFPNCKFEVDDVTLEWTYPPDHFDFIHSRQLNLAIKDWPRYIQQMFTHTKPGGWVELAETEIDARSDDGSLKEHHALAIYFELIHKAAKMGAFQLPLDKDLAQYMEDAGFVDVKIVKLKQPYAPWPKDPALKRIGQFSLMNVVDSKGMEAYGIGIFTRIIGMSEAEAKKLCLDTCKDIQNHKIHAYNYLWHVYGRKPLPEEL